MQPTYLGLEIGGTKLQLVRGDGTGNILTRHRLTVDRREGGPGIRRQIEAGLKALVPDGDSPRAFGVGFGGPIDWQTGAIQCSHQIDGWAGFELAAWLGKITGLPVYADNDANVAALGEALSGAGRGFNPVFYITLGSGVGGGLVVDGRIYHGAKPGEAEIGHVRLDPRGATVESRCSGWAVDRKIRQTTSARPASRLAQLIGPTPGGEARFLVAALAENDPVARQTLDEVATDLALGLSHVVHLMHPAVIVVGGGLSLVGEPLRQALAQALAPMIMQAFAPGPSVCLAGLGEDAVPVGALMLARTRCLPAPPVS